MPETDTSQKIDPLVKEVRASPEKFLMKYQHESAILEYKASFEYDVAMGTCPVVKKPGPR